MIVVAFRKQFLHEQRVAFVEVVSTLAARCLASGHTSDALVALVAAEKALVALVVPGLALIAQEQPVSLR